MKYKELNSAKEIKQILETLGGVLAVDTEYTELNVRKAELISIAISNGFEAYSIPARLVKHLKFLEKKPLLLFQNFGVDVFMLRKNGIDLFNTPFYDTMLMHHLLDENGEHNLDAMVKRYFNDNYKEIFWQAYEKIEDAPKEERIEYECKDAYYTARLAHMFLGMLKGRMRLVDHVHNLARALVETEWRGIRVDLPLIQNTKETMYAEIQSYLPKLREDFSSQVALWELDTWTEEMAKRKTLKGKQGVKRPEFNFASDSQVKWLLYEALKLPVIEKTKKGSPSTSYETIETLSKDHPELANLVSYKGAKTLYSTFVEGMLDRVEESRIYPRFNVNGTVTGRLGHSNPNMGNLPKEGIIRTFFLPDEGNSIIGADFSQLEVVVEANLTEDKQLLKIILEGASKHDITAHGLGIPRALAKTVNFALQYGAGVHKLSKILNCSMKEAQHQFDKYWEVYSGVKELKDKIGKMVEDQTPIVSPWGRLRHFPKALNDFELERFKRQGYNSLIQGTGADMTHYAYYKANQALQAEDLGRTLWQVHDEIVCEAPIGKEEFSKQMLVDIMRSASDEINFKYAVDAVPYGPFPCWRKT